MTQEGGRWERKGKWASIFRWNAGFKNASVVKLKERDIYIPLEVRSSLPLLFPLRGGRTIFLPWNRFEGHQGKGQERAQRGDGRSFSVCLRPEGCRSLLVHLETFGLSGIRTSYSSGFIEINEQWVIASICRARFVPCWWFIPSRFWQSH